MPRDKKSHITKLRGLVKDADELYLATDEDREGGFEFGGWQAPYFDDESGEAIGEGIERMDALLLGRKTYDIFAGYWPKRGEEDPIAATFNALPKFVVSRSLDRIREFASAFRIRKGPPPDNRDKKDKKGKKDG